MLDGGADARAADPSDLGGKHLTGRCDDDLTVDPLSASAMHIGRRWAN